jgi:N4-gp56 family major capsid protein
MPCSIKGKKYHVVVISPDQEFDLKERDAAWAQAQREAMRPGFDNPIFSGMSGMWNNTIIHVHERVPIATTWGSGANLNGATAMFLGCGAGGIAYAKRKIWNEKTFDYGNKVGFAIGAIYGVTKAVFNSADNSVVGVRTFRTNN